MQGAAALIRSIAVLLWPIVLIVLIVMLRGELGGLTRRLRRLSILGAEVELDEELSALDTKVKAASTAAELSQQTEHLGASGRRNESDDILRLAAISPRVALMALSERLEHTLVRVLASVSRAPDTSVGLASLPELVDLLPAEARPQQEALRAFLRVRTAILHAGEKVEDSDILRAIDSGLTLLRSLNAFPAETHHICEVLPLFADPECTQMLSSCRGVIVESTSPHGTNILVRRIFATSRTSHYRPGMCVSWEFDRDGSRAWGESWCRDTKTGSLRHLLGNLDFIGRDLDALRNSSPDPTAEAQ